MMDTKIQEAPKVKRETKNRIKVEFDRAPLKERIKAKMNGYFLGNIVWFLFRFIILLGVSFVIIYPFIDFFIFFINSSHLYIFVI